MWIDLLLKIMRRFDRCRRRSTLNLEAWKRGGKNYFRTRPFDSRSLKSLMILYTITQ